MIHISILNAITMTHDKNIYFDIKIINEQKLEQLRKKVEKKNKKIQKN